MRSMVKAVACVCVYIVLQIADNYVTEMLTQCWDKYICNSYRIESREKRGDR